MANDPDDPSNNFTNTWAGQCPHFTQENVTDLFCKSYYDKVACWPPTKAGSLAVIPCFAEFRDIKYDVTENATRLCRQDGTWEKNANYNNCKAIQEHHHLHLDNGDVNRWTMVIYFTGYSVSLAALIIALSIFLTFKDLRCLRNTFHTNLLLTYILVNITWICTAVVPKIFTNSQSGTCVLVILLLYFQGTNFFWMFVEGFYLYLLVVRTFQAGKVKVYVYMIIGWGLPMLVIGIWVIIKAQLIGKTEEHQLVLGQTATGCPWIQSHSYDYIYYCPILLVLSINILFLIQIMWVLITKLRVSTSAESQQYRNMYGFLPHCSSETSLLQIKLILWKAAKALLVLIPLLGVTYILFITAPDPNTDLSAAIFAYIRAILLSTQGFTVSVLYCFLNGDVRNSISRHWHQWRQRRSVNCNRKSVSCSGLDAANKLLSDDGTCLKMDNKSGGNCDTSVSYLTTTTSYLGNGYSQPQSQSCDTSLETDTHV